METPWKSNWVSKGFLTPGVYTETTTKIKVFLIFPKIRAFDTWPFINFPSSVVQPPFSQRCLTETWSGPSAYTKNKQQARKQAVFLITVVVGHYRKLDGKRTAFRLEASIEPLKEAIHVTEYLYSFFQVCLIVSQSRNSHRPAALDQVQYLWHWRGSSGNVV